MSTGAGSFVISFTNDPREDFGAFAKGYTLAGNRLTRILLDAPRFADYEAYPIAFLYRHAFELSLKQVIYRGRNLSALKGGNMISDLLNSHNCTILSEAAIRVLSELFPADDNWDNLFLSLRAMSAYWGQIDPSSYSYRYPIDNKGDTSTEKHQVLSLNELSAKMTLILDQLETIHFGLNLEIDRHLELCSDRISDTGFEDEF